MNKYNSVKHEVNVLSNILNPTERANLRFIITRQSYRDVLITAGEGKSSEIF